MSYVFTATEMSMIRSSVIRSVIGVPLPFSRKVKENQSWPNFNLAVCHGEFIAVSDPIVGWEDARIVQEGNEYSLVWKSDYFPEDHQELGPLRIRRHDPGENHALYSPVDLASECKFFHGIISSFTGTHRWLTLEIEKEELSTNVATLGISTWTADGDVSVELKIGRYGNGVNLVEMLIGGQTTQYLIGPTRRLVEETLVEYALVGTGNEQSFG